MLSGEAALEEPSNSAIESKSGPILMAELVRRARLDELRTVASKRIMLGVGVALAFASASASRAAAAANPCAPPARPFRLELHALKGENGTDLSLTVSSRTPACRAPTVLKRVVIQAPRERRARAYAHVRAPGGRAVIRLKKLKKHDRLKVGVVVLTAQTVRRQVMRGQVKVLLLPDLSVKLVAPPQALRDASFTVQARVAELNGDFAATATLAVTVGTTALTPTSVTVPAGTVQTISYPVTLAPEGAYPIVATLSGVTPQETRVVNDQAQATVEITSFQLAPATVLVADLAGFGAQFNQNVYAAISRNVGVTEANVKDMEAKVVALHPNFVRLFFLPNAYADPDLMQSFVRSAQLAQRAGATINVTWSGGTDDPAGNMLRFASTLADLVRTKGVTRLRWVTIQNEVNSSRITMQQYEQFYRLLDADLKSVGVRSQIRFMGGDLVGTVSPLGQTQDQWFAFLASNMSDLLDAWSVHIYWDYWDTAKMVRRLTEVRQIWDALPPTQRKPLYVTEYSPRGIRNPGGPVDPGAWQDGTLLAQTNINAFQNAWFDLLASKLGYYATSKWDAYFGKYDRGTQAYYMIGSPQEGWPTRPAYSLLRLFTATTAPGWKVVSVDGSYGNALVTGYTGPNGRVTVIGLDTDGAQLNGPSTTQIPYSLGGLPPNTAFQLLVWNPDGSGQLAPAASTRSDAAGVLTVTIPLHAVFALTTA